CDIGLVPGITHISHDEQKTWFKEMAGRYPGRSGFKGAGPYLLRFKGFSNAGRAFVFHQLGIPVVACFMPSHFHILGNPDCGYLAHSTEGWLKGLRELCSSVERRQKIADAAAIEFQRLYNPLSWAKRLHKQIEDLLEQK
ncbi:MAG: glycosyltransferase, partial [Spirochaetales bacterium]|nr:glycosyltransferase [Spirochaetales bacterium]